MDGLKVENREKKVESSAWALCSGRPLSAAGAAQVEDREGLSFGTHGGIAVRGAPKRASHALFPPFFSLIPTKRRCREDRGQRRIIIWDARRNCRARRAQARQPRTFPSFLLPTLYLALLPHPSSLPSAATSSRRAFFMLSLDIPMFFVYNLEQRVIFQSYPQENKTAKLQP